MCAFWCGCGCGRARVYGWASLCVRVWACLGAGVGVDVRGYDGVGGCFFLGGILIFSFFDILVFSFLTDKS